MRSPGRLAAVLLVLSAVGCSGSGGSGTSGSGAGRPGATFTVSVRGDFYTRSSPTADPVFLVTGGRVESGQLTADVFVPDGRIDCGLIGSTRYTSCSAEYAWGTTGVALRATADSAKGITYFGFAGACTGEGYCPLDGNADKMVLVRFLASRTGHVNFSDPAVHGPRYLEFEAGAPGAFRCTSCHGVNLQGRGIAVSCGACHSWPHSKSPVLILTDASPVGVTPGADHVERLVQAFKSTGRGVLVETTELTNGAAMNPSLIAGREVVIVVSVSGSVIDSADIPVLGAAASTRASRAFMFFNDACLGCTRASAEATLPVANAAGGWAATLGAIYTDFYTARLNANGMFTSAFERLPIIGGGFYSPLVGVPDANVLYVGPTGPMSAVAPATATSACVFISPDTTEFRNALSAADANSLANAFLSAATSATGPCAVTPPQPVFFGFRRSIEIVGSPAGGLAGYVVPVEVDTAALIAQGKLRSDLADLRFHTAAGTELPWWKDPGLDARAGKVWVRLDSLPVTGTTIYVHYGNPSAVPGGAFANNGRSTFDMFDDFESVSLETALWGTGQRFGLPAVVGSGLHFSASCPYNGCVDAREVQTVQTFTGSKVADFNMALDMFPEPSWKSAAFWVRIGDAQSAYYSPYARAATGWWSDGVQECPAVNGVFPGTIRVDAAAGTFALSLGSTACGSKGISSPGNPWVFDFSLEVGWGSATVDLLDFRVRPLVVPEPYAQQPGPEEVITAVAGP